MRSTAILLTLLPFLLATPATSKKHHHATTTTPAPSPTPDYATHAETQVPCPPGGPAGVSCFPKRELPAVAGGADEGLSPVDRSDENEMLKREAKKHHPAPTITPIASPANPYGTHAITQVPCPPGGPDGATCYPPGAAGEKRDVRLSHPHGEKVEGKVPTPFDSSNGKMVKMVKREAKKGEKAQEVDEVDDMTGAGGAGI